MTRRLLVLALVGGLGACDPDDACDPATDAACQPADTGTPSDGSLPYLYVEILDRAGEEEAASHTAGVDIVGVELVRAGIGTFADVVHHCSFGAEDNSAATNCTRALQRPVDGQGTCAATPAPDKADYVSLGGVGGTLVVSFDTLRLRQGDALRVYECGREHRPGAPEELYDVRIGVSPDPDDPSWVPCITGGTGIIECTVPKLPVVREG